MPQVTSLAPYNTFFIQGLSQLVLEVLRKKNENKVRKLSQKEEEKQVKGVGWEKRMKPKERFRKELGSARKGGEKKEGTEGKKGMRARKMQGSSFN